MIKPFTFLQDFSIGSIKDAEVISSDLFIFVRNDSAGGVYYSRLGYKSLDDLLKEKHLYIKDLLEVHSF